MEDKLNDKWINIEEAAEYLGVKPVTLRGWIRNDKGIPAHKIGKQWKTYIGVDEKITRTKSCNDLLQKLNSYDDSLLCSLVHKFGRRGGEATESDYDKYIDELKKALPSDFKANSIN